MADRHNLTWIVRKCVHHNNYDVLLANNDLGEPPVAIRCERSKILAVEMCRTFAEYSRLPMIDETEGE
jgi:hypothetical protein